MNNSDVVRIYEALAQTYETFDHTDDDWTRAGLSATPYRQLVAVALSTMTTSRRTIAAATALFDRADSFESLAALEDDELREMIRTVAHYNRKTRQLKAMADQILTEHNGQIPDSRDELMGLPGIGRKCTDIILTFLHDKPAVAVDTHVHRAVNRLGITATATAEATADALNAATPMPYRRHAHEWLIQLGMKVCVARRPRCGECPVSTFCDYRRKETRAAGV